MIGVLLLVLAGTPSPLAIAREHLAAGKLDEVLFDLDGKPLADADKAGAGELLAHAGEAALRKQDAVLALQFAQMALRQTPGQALALEVGARACREQKQYGSAEDYAEKWLQATHGARAGLLRAELATDQGDWQHGLEYASPVHERDLSADERVRLTLVKETCKKELTEKQVNFSEVKSLEAKLEAAAERAKKLPRDPTRRQEALPVAGNDVVLYGTSWCGYCAQARAYLHSRGVAFSDRDVEKDPAAAEELAMKQASAGQRGSGVPWIDVRGTLVHGFDKPTLDRLLR